MGATGAPILENSAVLQAHLRGEGSTEAVRKGFSTVTSPES